MRSRLPILLLGAALALGAGASAALDADGSPPRPAVADPSAPGPQALVSSGERLVFVPLAEPCRLFDLRPGQFNVGPRATPIGTDETIVLDAHGSNGQCNISTDAESLVMNVTALNATDRTFLALWPSGQRPQRASSLNPAPGQPPTPNAVTVGLDSSGRFRLYNKVGTVDVLADIVGYYADHDHDDRYDTSAEVDSKIASAVGSLAVTQPNGPTHGRQMHGFQALAGVDTTMDTQVAVDPFGQTVFSFVDTSGDPSVGRCVDPRCSTVSPSATFATNGSVVAILEMAIDPNGDPAFLVGRSTGDLDYITCLSFCVGGNTTTVTTTGSTGDLTFDASGNPVIAYESKGTQIVQANICDDPACSSHTLVDLAPHTSGEAAVEVAMHTFGAPVFAVARSTSAGIAVVSCGDATCTPALMETHTVESGRTPIAESLSMVLGPNGAPVISFVDAATLATVVVQCAEELCSVDVSSFVAAASGTIDTEVVVDGAGLVAVLVEQSSAPGGSTLVRCAEYACSTTPVSIPLGDALGDLTVDLAVNHEGVPVMSGVTASDLVSIEQVAGDSHVPGGGS